MAWIYYLYGTEIRACLFTSFGFASCLVGVVKEEEFVPFGFWWATVYSQSPEGFLNTMHVGYTPRNIGSLVGGCWLLFE
jgi:hypothetical protein